MIRGWIGTSNVAKELQTSHTDDVCEWWLGSASADLFIRNAGPPRIYDADTTGQMHPDSSPAVEWGTAGTITLGKVSVISGNVLQ